MSQQPNYNALSPAVTDPTVLIAQEHLAKLHDLEVGKAYEMSADAPLCAPSEIGLPDMYLGSKLSVAGEFGIPAVHSTAKDEGVYQHVAVVAITNPENQTGYVVMGLLPDTETGKMKIVPGGSSSIGHGYGGPDSAILGRTPLDKGGIDPARLWGEGATYGLVVSRVHIKFTATEGGKLRAETLGQYGTKGDIGRTVQGVGEAVASNPVQQQEVLKPNPELRFQPVENDPAFQQIAQPYRAALRAVQDRYVVESAQLETDYQYDQRAGRARETEILKAKHKLFEQIATEQAPLRKQYEAALKPYLEARLRLFEGDQKPGYLQPGQVILERFGAKSADGKSISSYDKYASAGGNAKFSETSVNPRFGQLIIDTRGGSSWGASWTAEKTDDKTGEKMKSAERAVNLAAAMVAGTYRGSDDPVQYRRANDADLVKRGIDLSADFRAKVPIYTVTLGMHRTIAERLISGNDAVFQADQMDR